MCVCMYSLDYSGIREDHCIFAGNVGSVSAAHSIESAPLRSSSGRDFGRGSQVPSTNSGCSTQYVCRYSLDYSVIRDDHRISVGGVVRRLYFCRSLHRLWTTSFLYENRLWRRFAGSFHEQRLVTYVDILHNVGGWARKVT